MRRILSGIVLVAGCLLVMANSASAAGVLIVSAPHDDVHVAIRARGNETWTGEGIVSADFLSPGIAIRFQVTSGGFVNGLVVLSGVVTDDNWTDGQLLGEEVLVLADPVNDGYLVSVGSVFAISRPGTVRIWKDHARQIPK